MSDESKKEENKNNQKKCPYCSAIIPITAKKCEHCHTDFSIKAQISWWIQTLGIIIGLGLLLVAICNLNTTVKNFNMQQKFFIETNRPILRLNLIKTSDIKFDKQNIKLTVHLNIENIGESPASDVLIMHKWVFPPNSTEMEVGAYTSINPQQVYVYPIALSNVSKRNIMLQIQFRYIWDFNQVAFTDSMYYFLAQYNKEKDDFVGLYKLSNEQVNDFLKGGS